MFNQSLSSISLLTIVNSPSDTATYSTFHKSTTSGHQKCPPEITTDKWKNNSQIYMSLCFCLKNYQSTLEIDDTLSDSVSIFQPTFILHNAFISYFLGFFLLIQVKKFVILHFPLHSPAVIHLCCFSFSRIYFYSFCLWSLLATDFFFSLNTDNCLHVVT